MTLRFTVTLLLVGSLAACRTPAPDSTTGDELGRTTSEHPLRVQKPTFVTAPGPSSARCAHDRDAVAIVGRFSEFPCVSSTS
jgi:hypothetical protein